MSVLALVTSIPITSYAAGKGDANAGGDNSSNASGGNGNGSFNNNMIGL